MSRADQKLKSILKRYVKWIFLSAAAGILAGISSAIFLHLLDWATRARTIHPKLIMVLPLAGLVSGIAYHRYGKHVEKGHNLILDEIHDPKTTLPVRMAPLVLFGTILTHLFGGSAGREGTAVQMGASLSDQLSKFFGIDNGERKILLVAGAGAGFGAAIGAPFAGTLFGMEVIYVSGLRVFAVVECLIASFVSYYTSILLRAPHSKYPSITIPDFNLKVFGAVLAAGVLFGVAAILFVKLTHLIEGSYKRLSVQPWLRPVIGGGLLVFLYKLSGTYKYAGLGIPMIQKAIVAKSSYVTPVLKGVFTALTVGSGFKGGEFIPLVFIGATLGSALSQILPASPSLLGAVGFAAVFAGASNTPIACAVMAVEIFGLPIAPYAFAGCLMSYYFSGHRGIYHAQRFEQTKLEHLKEVLSWFGELPNRFFNGGRK